MPPPRRNSPPGKLHGGLRGVSPASPAGQPSPLFGGLLSAVFDSRSTTPRLEQPRLFGGLRPPQPGGGESIVDPVIAKNVLSILPGIGEVMDARDLIGALRSNDPVGAALAGLGVILPGVPNPGRLAEAAVRIGNRDVKVTKPVDTDVIIEVDADALERNLDAIARTRSPVRVDRLERFAREADAIEAPQIALQPPGVDVAAQGGRIAVQDGRHRIELFRRLGQRKIPVAVDASQADEVRRLLK